MKLSVFVIVCNNEAMIRRCLESVAWADEIAVLDSGSTDRTTEISRKFTATVRQTPDFPGYGPQKLERSGSMNAALSPGAAVAAARV